MLHLSVKNKPIDIKQRLGLFSCALIFLIFLLPLSLSAQTDPVKSLDQTSADQPADTVRVNQLLKNSTDILNKTPDEGLRLAEEAIQLASELGYKMGEAKGYKNIGIGHYFKGDFSEVVASWLKSISLFEEIGYKVGVSNIQSNLSALYQTLGDDPSALKYARLSIKNAEEIQDTLRIASAYVNLGAAYANEAATYEQALDAYTMAMDMCKDIDYQSCIGISLINLGDLYLNGDPGEPRRARGMFEEALEIYEKTGQDQTIAMRWIGDTYMKERNYDEAEIYYDRSVNMAIERGFKAQESEAHLKLASLYNEKGYYDRAEESYQLGLKLARVTGILYDQSEAYEGLAKLSGKQGNYKEAYEYEQLLTEIKDSIKDDDYAKSKANFSVLFDLENKEKEIVLLNTRNELSQVQIDRDAKAKMFLYITLGLFLAIIAGVIYQLLYIRNSNKKLAFERNKSEQILLNILPKETADELKEHGQIKAKQFESITVLFTDFKEFSLAAEEMPADALVKSVDFYFKAFDEITERHNLEKIKTIGDSYMCAGGLPTENDTHAQDAYNAAVEMLDFVKKVLNDPPHGVHTFEVRIGLNTGPVVAGVVGIKKFAYDIWGSTVNIASRMESSSIPGKINVSENTYQLLKDKQQFTYRGEIEVKNKQVLKMYFAEEEAAVAV